jgi:DNA-directed RNA polymerase subunit H (RpoH/RPB5)
MELFNLLIEVIDTEKKNRVLNRIKINKEKLNKTKDPEKRKIIQNKIQIDTIRLKNLDLED